MFAHKRRASQVIVWRLSSPPMTMVLLNVFVACTSSTNAARAHSTRWPADVKIKPSDAPGWLVERMFHSEGVKCPWLSDDDAAHDPECQSRESRISELRGAISTCKAPLAKNVASIAHRGGPLVAPEETIASWTVGIEGGAGIIECDSSPTKDLYGEELFVCRHSNCDMHFTTDIIANHPQLASKCSEPFTPANSTHAASAKCCTYDFDPSELRSLCSTMEQTINTKATKPGEFLLGAPGFRSAAIAEAECHPLVFLHEYISFAKLQGVSTIPELKDTWTPGQAHFLAAHGKSCRWLADRFAKQVSQAFPKAQMRAGWTTAAMAGELAIMQTFDHRVAAYWKSGQYKSIPVEFMWLTYKGGTATSDCVGKEQLVQADCGTSDILHGLAKAGVEMLSPPVGYYLGNNGHSLVASEPAKKLKELASSYRNNSADNYETPTLGSWSLERSGCNDGAAGSLQPGTIGPCGFYYDTTPSASELPGVADVSAFQHSDELVALDVMFKEVGIVGIFSDFPATVSAYANCVLSANAASGSA